MVRSISHKGLKKLYEKGQAQGVSANHLQKVRRILASLDAAATTEDLRVPAYNLHPLKGDLSGHWAISVSGNWRVTFRFVAGDRAYDVDLIDYH